MLDEQFRLDDNRINGLLMESGRVNSESKLVFYGAIQIELLLRILEKPIIQQNISIQEKQKDRFSTLDHEGE